MSQVPPGFIFQPTVEVLLLCYLLPKITNTPLPSPNPVKEKDLYKDCPDKIWDELIKGQSFGNSDIFIFTKLRHTKERINRTVDAGGKWSQEDNEEVLSSDTNINIGNRRQFSYQNDTNKSTGNKHGGWVMYEYRLNDSMLPASSGDNNRSYALCQLRKNKTDSRKRKAQPQFQDFHPQASFPSSSNLNQPITQASNSEPEPGEIEISGAQSYQPPQFQDSATDVVYPSSEARFFQPQLQVQDSLTNGVTSSFNDNNPSCVLCQLRKNKTNSRKRKAQPQFQNFHSQAAFPSSSNLNQPITQASNSEPEPGEIEISGAQSYQPPQFQDSPTDVVFPSSEAQFFQPQLQVQDSLTNGVPSSFNLPSFWTTYSGLEQEEIEISTTQIQPLLQLQDPPTNSVVPSNSNRYQPVLSTTDSEYEQRETQIRSGTRFQPQPGDCAQYYFPTESYEAQSQPQPQTDGCDIGAVVHPYTISTGVSARRLV